MAKLCSAFLRVMGNGIVFSLPDGQQISLSKIDGRYAPPSKLLCVFVSRGQAVLPFLRWSRSVELCSPLEERCASRVSHSKGNQKSSQTRVMGKLCSTFQDGQVVLTFQGRDVSWLCQFSGHLRGSYLGLNNADAADLQHVRKNVWEHENI